MAYISVDDKPKPRPLIAFPLPYHTTLKGNKQVELRRILKETENYGSGAEALETARILDAVWHLLNYEIVECGDSYPFPPKALTRAQCLEYFGGGELFVLLETGKGGDGNNETHNTYHNATTGASYDFGPDILGAFYIKPNYPYRSSIVCNGGFMVVPQHQNSGIRLGTLFRTFLDALPGPLQMDPPSALLAPLPSRMQPTRPGCSPPPPTPLRPSPRVRLQLPHSNDPPY